MRLKQFDTKQIVLTPSSESQLTHLQNLNVKTSMIFWFQGLAILKFWMLNAEHSAGAKQEGTDLFTGVNMEAQENSPPGINVEANFKTCKRKQHRETKEKASSRT